MTGTATPAVLLKDWSGVCLWKVLIYWLKFFLNSFSSYLYFQASRYPVTPACWSISPADTGTGLCGNSLTVKPPRAFLPSAESHHQTRAALSAFNHIWLQIHVIIMLLKLFIVSVILPAIHVHTKTEDQDFKPTRLLIFGLISNSFILSSKSFH